MSESCCHVPDNKPGAHAHPQQGAAAAAPAAHGHHAVDNSWRSAARITLHCLTGCAIGEWTGLAIGVSLGFSVGATVALAVALAFVFGFALTIFPMVRRGLSVAQAFRIVWLGELTSIAVMELVMNVVDYQLGGMGAGMSLLHPQFWAAFSVAAVAGYLAAWPVNKWLLSRNLKNCH
jgi:hypothetical protein